MPDYLSPASLRRTRLLLAAFACAVAPAAAHGEALQPWPDVLVTAPLAKGFLMSGEAIARIADDRRMSQLETRAQIGHVFSPKVTVWIGWVHFANYIPHAPNGHEDQMVEQINWAIGAAGPLRLSTRTRLEQRFLSGVDATGWRWRQQVRVATPLGGKGAPSAILWAEPFVAINRTAGQHRTLDQLRFFAGVSLPVSHRVDLEVGYLNQRIYRANTTIVNDAIPLIVTVRF